MWTTTTDGSTGVTSAQFSHEDTGIKGASYEANSELPETLEHTMPNYGVSAQINNYHFVGKCWHPKLDDATTYIFRSKAAKFDTFDWVTDFVKLPTVPTALISFNGRIWAFDDANTYKIEPNSNKAIKALLKFRTGRSDVFAITADPMDKKLLKKLEIGINIVTHKGTKTIIEKISDTESKVLPFSGI